MTNVSIEEAFMADLERGLDEFFNASTSNERKKQIEQRLHQLRTREDNLQFSIQLIQRSNSPYVVWFACATLTDLAIPQRWPTLQDDHALQARKFVLEYLMENFAKVERFLRAKAALVLVAIAKVDWPRRYVEYFDEVKTLASSPQHQMLGLTLLRLTVEEVSKTNRRNLMTSQRRVEVEGLLRMKLPEICSLLTEVLSAQLRLPVNDRESPACLVCFEVFLQVCAGFHPNEFLQQDLMEVCFQYAMQWRVSLTHSVEALRCINEILDKRYIPKTGNYDQFVSSIATHLLQLLQSLCSANTNGNAQGSGTLDEELTGQFSRFLQVFVQIHLRRLDSKQGGDEFPVQHFLSILLVYTTLIQRQVQTTADAQCFLQCLDLWELVLDRVDLLAQEQGPNDVKVKIAVYVNGLTPVMDHLVTLLLWKQNGPFLEALSEASTIYEAKPGMNKSTEQATDSFHLVCSRAVTVVARIAVCPDVDTATGLELLLNRVFTSLQQYLPKVESDTVAAKDCATMFTIASKVTPALSVPSRFTKTLEGAWKLLEWAFQIVQHCNAKKSFMQGAHFVALHLHALDLLAAMAPWLAQARVGLETGGVQLGNTQIRALQGMEQFNQLVSDILTQSIMVLDTSISPPPEALMRSSICVLAQLSRITVPFHFIAFAPVDTLVNNLERATLAIPVAPAQQLTRTLSDAVFASVASNDRHNPAKVEEAKQVYVRCFKWTVEAITKLAGEQAPRTAQTSRKYFMMLTALTASVRTEGTFQKKLTATVVLPAMKPTVDLLLQFLVHATTNPVAAKAAGSLSGARDAFDLVINAYDSLLSQMSKEDAEGTANTLVNFVQKQNVPDLIRSSAGTGGAMLVLKLIQFLTVVVGSPRSFDNVASAMCTIILEQLGIVLTWSNSGGDGAQDDTLVDIREQYYRLIHTLLRSRWRWFFSRVSANADMVSSRQFINEARQQSFVQAMEIFLRSLRDQALPPASFRANILVFDDLNKTHNLYTVPLFRAQMLPAFTGTLLDLVRLKTHEICEEEIMHTIYGLAAVDFDKFFNEILTQYVAKIKPKLELAGQIPNVSRDTNPPGFCANIRSFMHDFALLADVSSA